MSKQLLRFIPLSVADVGQGAAGQFCMDPSNRSWTATAARSSRRAAGWRFTAATGTTRTERLPALAEALAALPARFAILDCELVKTDRAGLPSCWLSCIYVKGDAVQGSIFYCFDLLHLNGREVRAEPLAARSIRMTASLESVFRSLPASVASFDRRPRFAGSLREHGLEGCGQQED